MKIIEFDGDQQCYTHYMEPDTKEINSVETSGGEMFDSPLKKYRYIIHGIGGLFLLIAVVLFFLPQQPVTDDVRDTVSESVQEVIEKDSNITKQLLDQMLQNHSNTLQVCEVQDELTCFGSGRKITPDLETEAYQVYALVSTDEITNYGLKNKKTGELSILRVIEKEEKPWHTTGRNYISGELTYWTGEVPESLEMSFENCDHQYLTDEMKSWKVGQKYGDFTFLGHQCDRHLSFYFSGTTTISGYTDGLHDMSGTPGSFVLSQESRSTFPKGMISDHSDTGITNLRGDIEYATLFGSQHSQEKQRIYSTSTVTGVWYYVLGGGGYHGRYFTDVVVDEVLATSSIVQNNVKSETDVITVIQDEYKFEVTDEPILSDVGGSFRVIYKGETYVKPLTGSVPYVSVDLKNVPSTEWFITGIDIAGDSVPDVGVMSNESLTEYDFYRLNGKAGVLESTGVKLSRVAVDNFYKRDFVGRYKEDKISWDGISMTCHQLVLTEVPHQYSDLKTNFSSQMLINLPWSDISESDRSMIQESETPVIISLERYFPETSSRATPCYSEFTYHGLKGAENKSIVETELKIFTIEQFRPVTIGDTTYSSSTGTNALSYDEHAFYIYGSPVYTTSEGNFEIYPTVGQAQGYKYLRLGGQIYGMRFVGLGAVELHAVIGEPSERIRPELFKDLGYGYATHPSLGAGETQMHYVTISGSIAASDNTDFLHLEAIEEPVATNPFMHRGKVLEGLGFDDLDIGEGEGKPTGYYLRSGNAIYVQQVNCHLGSFYVDGTEEDIDNWQPGC